MCAICSRRTFIAGLVSLPLSSSDAFAQPKLSGQIACAAPGEVDVSKLVASMRPMPDGDARFHRALVRELNGIVAFFQVNPWFQYVDDENAFATPDNVMSGSSGLVMIGVPLLRKLLAQEDGGVSVAAVLAHECAHILQYKMYTNDQLKRRLWNELHADVLSGFYLAKKLNKIRDGLSVHQRQLLLLSTNKSKNTGDHGLASQRNICVDKGFNLYLEERKLPDAVKQAELFVEKVMTL